MGMLRGWEESHPVCPRPRQGREATPPQGTSCYMSTPERPKCRVADPSRPPPPPLRGPQTAARGRQLASDIEVEEGGAEARAPGDASRHQAPNPELRAGPPPVHSQVPGKVTRMEGSLPWRMRGPRWRWAQLSALLLSPHHWGLMGHHLLLCHHAGPTGGGCSDWTKPSRPARSIEDKDKDIALSVGQAAASPSPQAAHTRLYI